jgi:prepilin-type N-terminal cleavage/methylation domain-containing protein
MDAIRSRLAAIERGERGMTLVELIVSMAIFSVVLVVFLGALGAMAKTTVKSEVASDSADQLRNVFLRMDKEVRYASDINTPATANGSIYVEYWVPASAKDGESTCVQWRYVKASDKLQRRTWVQGDPDSVTGWATLATRLRNDLNATDQQPFTIHRAGTFSGKTYLHQRLDIYLSNGLGTDHEDPRGSQLDVSFVAQNSSTASVTNGGSTSVCLTGTVGRP